MADLFTIENLATLAMLTLLQAVLGFDNLLYISIESKRVDASQQARVRRIGIALAIILRIVLLFVLMSAIQYFQEPFGGIHLTGIIEGTFNVHNMISVDDLAHEGEGDSKRTAARAIFWIVLMNLVFSFDSILSAIALTEVFWVMAAAIVLSGAMMIFLADHVSEFLEKNRMYEVLGLFVLLIVGILLLSEGGHLAHLALFGYPVEPMAKSTFYFVIGVLVIVDVIQGRYQRKLLLMRKVER
jgi:predicted tellurium resistance membrane protein TerC